MKKWPFSNKKDGKFTNDKRQQPPWDDSNRLRPRNSTNSLEVVPPIGVDVTNPLESGGVVWRCRSLGVTWGLIDFWDPNVWNMWLEPGLEKVFDWHRNRDDNHVDCNIITVKLKHQQWQDNENNDKTMNTVRNNAYIEIVALRSIHELPLSYLTFFVFLWLKTKTRKAWSSYNNFLAVGVSKYKSATTRL